MAVQERSVRNSVCLNHPDRPASTRCTVCFKPVCSECAIMAAEGSVFCSQECLGKYDRTRDSVESWHEVRTRERARRRRRTLIKAIILIGLGVAAYLYFTRHPGKLDQLKDKAGKAVNEVKREVRK